MQWSLNQMFVAFYLWVRAMLLGVWCMKWYSRNGGRLNIRICVSGSHVGNDEQGVVLYFYVIVYDSRMSLSNVSLPIWHWCSPSVLPLTHPSPFSPKPALEEPRRTSHPEREEEIRIMLSGGIFPPRSPSRPRFIGSRSRRWCRWKGGFSRLGCLALGVDCQLVDRPRHRGEKLPEENETVREPVKP